MGFFGAYFGADPGGGGGGDPPPVITLVSPSSPSGFSATYTTARATPVVIDIVDTTNDIGYIAVLARLPGEAYHLVVQGDITADYEAEYDSASTVTAITDGMRLSILPDGKWPPGALSLLVIAVGDTGSEANDTFTWIIQAPAQTESSADVRDSVWRWRRRLNKQKCSVISVAIDDNYSDGPGFTLTALALEIGRKPGLDRIAWRGGSNTNTSGSGDINNGR